MQYTEEQLKRILEKRQWAADKPALEAGDEPKTAEDAKVERILAKRAAKAEASPVPRETSEQLAGADANVLQEALHIGKGVGRMALDSLNTPYYLRQIAGMGLNALGAPTEEQQRRDFAQSQDPLTQKRLADIEQTFAGQGQDQPWTQELMESVLPDGSYAAVENLIAGEVVDADANPWVDRARTAMEWSNPFKLKSVATALRSNLDEVAAPLGAAGGEAIVNEMNQDRSVGELSGGTMGTALQLGMNAFGRGKRAITEAPFRVIEEQGVELPSAIDAAREGLAAGDRGTTADLVGDRDLFDLESVATADNRVKTRVRDAQDERTAQIANRIRAGLGTESPELARETATNYVEQRSGRIADAERSVNEKAAEAAELEATGIEEALPEQRQIIAEQVAAMEAADEAAERAGRTAGDAQKPVTSDELPYEAGMRLRDNITAEEKAFKDGVEAEAWKKFLDGPNLDIPTLERATSNGLQGLTQGQKQGMLEKYKKLIRKGSNWKRNQSAKPVDVKEWLQDLRAEAYKADPQGGFTNEQYALRKYIDGVEQGIADSSSAAAESFKAAKDLTRERYTRFHPDKLNAAMRAEPEQFGDRLGVAGSSGAAASRVVEGTQIPDSTDQMVAMLRAEAGAGNGVDDAFMKRYGPVLNELPDEVSQEFSNAAMTAREAKQLEAAAKDQSRLSTALVKKAESEVKVLEKAADAARAEGAKVPAQSAKRVAKLESALQNSIVSRYSESPDKVVEQLLTKSDSADDLRRLNDYMDNTGGGDSFRADLQRKLTDLTMTMPNASVKARPERIQQFNKLVGNLKRADVITADQADGFIAEMAKSSTVEMRQNALKSMLVEEEGEWQNLLASAISAAVLSGAGGSQSLLVGAAVRRWVFKRLSQKGVKAPEVERLEKLLLDPEEFIKGGEEWIELKKTMPERDLQEAVDKRMRKLISVGQSSAAASGEDDRDR